LSVLRWRDVRRQFRRKVRQMRGRVENAAVKRLVHERGYPALPRFADDMIADYLLEHDAPMVPVQDRLFMALALRQHLAARRPDEASLQIVCIR
jgi:hypothetical protein